MLQTNLKHIETAKDLQATIDSNENVMVCCGRMGPMCIPVYAAMEQLEKEYTHVAFRDMEFDSPEAAVIRNLPECRDFMGLPYTIYYKGGNVAAATTSIQDMNQIRTILDREFSK